jgi:ribonuclease HII
VFAAAVILPPDFHNEELNDSKQLSEKKTVRPASVIEKEALSWASASSRPRDRSHQHPQRLVPRHAPRDRPLTVRPEHLLIDGNRSPPYPGIPHTTIVKGDAKYLNIAAASILAKTWRDDYNNESARQYPGYHWEENKGYPTRAHREAIRRLGITPLHRKTFTLLPEQLTSIFSRSRFAFRLKASA